MACVLIVLRDTYSRSAISRNERHVVRCGSSRSSAPVSVDGHPSAAPASRIVRRSSSASPSRAPSPGRRLPTPPAPPASPPTRGAGRGVGRAQTARRGGVRGGGEKKPPPHELEPHLHCER